MMDDDRRTRLKHVLIFALIIGLLVALIMLDKKDDTTQDSIRVQTTSQDLISVRAARYLEAVHDDRTKARSAAGKPDAGTQPVGRGTDSGRYLAAGVTNFSTGSIPSDEIWYALFGCETGGTFNAAIVSEPYNSAGDRYWGGLQFTLGTWASVGGTGLPTDHPWEVQREFGIRLWQREGWDPWPYCADKLGLR